MPAHLDDDLLILLSKVARHMRTYSDQLARTHGMTRAQLIILARLELQPGISQSELAAIAEVSPVTIARQIDRLVKLGLVERRIDPADRRIWRLGLTLAAAPLLREIRRYRADLSSAVTEGIDPEVVDTVALGLRYMKKNLRALASVQSRQSSTP